MSTKPLTALQPQQHCHKTANGAAATARFPTTAGTALQPHHQSHKIAHRAAATAPVSQNNARRCSHSIIINHHSTTFTKLQLALQLQRNSYKTTNGAAATATILSTTGTSSHNYTRRCSHSNILSKPVTALQPQHHFEGPRGVSKSLTALQPQPHCHKTANGAAATARFPTTAGTFA